ncbi:hypothetical protein C4D60_Mb09t07520 [Musa balbisiana]|uniref:Pyruvate kinase n=1 Tax=Musa balbisiana TaxID=52838 RepID=A0A4V4H331_MUSBA|nr:hypothetical protein C4D60_Mb09t07520 [Musa balbisiana]
MHGGQMLLEEPVRLASVLAPSKTKFFPSLTKIVGTLGSSSRSVETIEACLTAGMSVARFDFSWLTAEYHQETLDNLKKAVSNVKKPCAVMLDTVGPELQVHNTPGEPIELKAGNHVIITPDLSRVPSAEILPINFTDLAKAVKNGDTIFIGQYLFTGSETTSVWLEVLDTAGKDINCLVKNSARLAGSIFTMHVSQVAISLPTLTSSDKQVISTWGLQNNVDLISLSYTRHAEDVREVFVFQKTAIQKCNMAGKPAIITRVVDSMVDNLRPTRAEATDVANAVLDGTDGISLGAETLRGLYPVETIRTVGQICAEAESVYNHSHQFKRIVQYVGEPMSHEESVASSAVRAAIKVKAAVIVVFTSSGRASRLIAKYRPPMPVLAVVFPQEGMGSVELSSFGITQARQCLAVRGVYPILAPSRKGDASMSKEESGLKLALGYGRSVGILKPYDRAVIFEKIGDSSVVKIIEFEDS